MTAPIDFSSLALEEIVRLTMLLDSYERTTPVPQQQRSQTVVEPSRSEPASTGTFRASNEQFNSLLDGLLPCRSEDSDLWFAEQAPEIERAKILCQACPLQAGCLQGALDRAEPWAVWGGEVLVDGQVVAAKRGRGRPRKTDPAVIS